MDTLAELYGLQTPPDLRNVAQNAPYVRPGPNQYNTALNPLEEMAFRQWVQNNKVPFDPNAALTDYDMRGLWQARMSGDPRATGGVNPNDHQMHYPDYWKTPLHKTFSNESQWAGPMAPQWNDQDQIVAPSGRIVLDERAPRPTTLADMFRLVGR